jgi:hypothetical protein
MFNSRKGKETAMKKQLPGKILSLFIIVCLTFMTAPSLALASEQTKAEGPSIEDYQVIIDKLNAEYDTDFHFFTEKEIAELGLPEVDINKLGTLEEYESLLRSELEEVVRSNAYAERMTALAEKNAVAKTGVMKMQRVPIVENGKVIGEFCYSDPGLKVPNPITGAQALGLDDHGFNGFSNASPTVQLSISAVASGYYSRGYSTSWGINPTAIGSVSNGNGFWQWTAMPLLASSWIASYGYPRLSVNDSTGYLTDNARTAASTYIGIWYSSSTAGGTNMSKYVEFNAGSAANSWGY